MFANRIRFSASALVISGILFVIYPALRPFSDEGSLLGAAAFGSGAWLASHMLAIVAFTLLPLGLLGLQRSLLGTSAERLLFVAVVLSMIGTGFTLPFYGGEAYGLHALGQEALRQNSCLSTRTGRGHPFRPRPRHVPCRPAAPCRLRNCDRSGTLALLPLSEGKRRPLRRRDVPVHSAILRHAAPPHCAWTTGRSRLRVDGRLSLAATAVGQGEVVMISHGAPGNKHGATRPAEVRRCKCALSGRPRDASKPAHLMAKHAGAGKCAYGPQYRGPA